MSSRAAKPTPRSLPSKTKAMAKAVVPDVVLEKGAEAAVALAEAGIGRRTGRILFHTANAFMDDKVTRLGAALAFYTTIAVAPLMVLAIAVAGFFFDQDDARKTVIGEIEHLAGSPASSAISAIQSPTATATGAIATVLAVGTMLFGALGVFQHMQDALNSIWRVKVPIERGWRVFLRRRIFSLATVIATGFLLMVSLVASALLSYLGAQAAHRFGLPVMMFQVLNNLLSLLVVTFLFAMIFKLLPDTPIRWRHVWLGALATGVLFTIGKSVLGFYLGRASVTSAYGAAGSLVALLLWCYYAAQIVFLGAEFTRVTAMSRGGRDFSSLTAQADRTT